MTGTGTATTAQQQVERSVAGPAASLLERVAERLGGTASVSAVYGEPVDREGVTIIPVAKVSVGFGGGAGKGRKESETGEGGGGGGGAASTPLGYIEIKDGNAVFKPIRDPIADVVVPLAIVVLGSTGSRMLRTLVRRRRLPRR